MQDNAPSHRAEKTKNYFIRNRIRILNWPTYSPDMNPIENVWGILKKKIAIRRPKTKKEIIEIAEQEWKKFPNKLIDNLYRNMHVRIKSVIKNHGNPTKY